MKATSSPSSGTAGFLGALLAGGLSAAAYAIALRHSETFLLGFIYATSFPLLMGFFGAGLLSGLSGLLLALGIVAITTNLEAMLIYFLAIALPSALLGGLSLRTKEGSDGKVYWYPEGYLLTGLSLYPAALFSLFAFLDGTWGQGLLDRTRSFLDQLLTQASGSLPPEAMASLPAIADSWSRMLPGTFGISFIVFVLASGYLAQKTLKQQNWNLRPSFTWENLTIPSGLLIGIAVTGLTAIFAPNPFAYVAANLCFFLCIPMFFLGLTVVHLYARRMKQGGKLFLIFFYLILSILLWLAVLVALLGALDQGLHLRQRLSNLPNPT